MLDPALDPEVASTLKQHHSLQFNSVDRALPSHEWGKKRFSDALRRYERQRHRYEQADSLFT